MANAQTQEPTLMRSLQPGEITLTESENTFYQEHLGFEYTASATLVWVGDVLDYYDGHSVTFTVPNSNNLLLTADAAYAQSQSASNYNWAGTINGSGILSLNNSGGLMSGFIQTDDQSWTILPLRAHYSLLLKHNMAAFSGGDDCLVLPGGTFSETDNCADEYNSCPAVIDVLLFATSAALNFVQKNGCQPCFDVFIQGGENVTNVAFERSDIPNKRVRFRWVGYDPMYLPNNDILSVINFFESDNTVNQALINYKADLAVLVTNEGYDGQIFGVANIGEFEDPDPTHRHCVVEIPFFFAPRFTLTHELSHLMGALHNRSENVPCNNGCGSDRDICAHGWRFPAGGTDRRTIHARTNAIEPGDPGMRILNFSNPDVTFLGEPTGNEENNNARMIRNTGCLVAGYAPNPEFGVILGGDTRFCYPHGQSKNPIYTAVIFPAGTGFPGIPPYTIEWWRNTSGIFTYQAPDVYMGSSAQIQFGLPPACPQFYLHIRVTSADGIVRTATRTILTEDCFACFEEPGGDERSSSASPLGSEIGVSPNPSSGFFRVEMPIEKQTQLDILLFDARGQLIRNLGSETLEPGTGTFERNVEGIPPGFYWVSLLTDAKKTSLPLIILK
ncbi:MAG: T9SS type A sorting domain-containing protein [Saprospiraceae bacterium]